MRVLKCQFNIVKGMYQAIRQQYISPNQLFLAVTDYYGFSHLNYSVEVNCHFIGLIFNLKNIQIIFLKSLDKLIPKLPQISLTMISKTDFLLS